MRESILHTDSITASDAAQETLHQIPAPTGTKRMILNMGP